MLSPKVQDALNKQIQLEADSSQYYLAMASWAETKGLNGTSMFLYRQADEERVHMLKLIKYVNERGGQALIPAIQQPPKEFSNLTTVFTSLLNHEMKVTQEVNSVVHICLEEKDYTIAIFPLMVNSKYCSLRQYKGLDKNDICVRRLSRYC